MRMIGPSRILRWFKRSKRNPYYITNLWDRYDDWCRSKEYKWISLTSPEIMLSTIVGHVSSMSLLSHETTKSLAKRAMPLRFRSDTPSWAIALFTLRSAHWCATEEPKMNLLYTTLGSTTGEKQDLLVPVIFVCLGVFLYLIALCIPTRKGNSSSSTQDTKDHHKLWLSANTNG